MSAEPAPSPAEPSGTAPSRRAVLLPTFGLFLLAPLVGEFLLGNATIDQLGLLPLFAPMYGGGALLIREVARRAGRGWPTILTLAVAYGLLEEGILDQLLFNPSYSGLDLLSAAYVPVLGVSAQTTVTVLAMHAVWSIAVPIALVEALAGRSRTSRTAPWLGRTGLAVTTVVFVLGSALVFWLHQVEERFMATPPQLAGTSAVIVALVAAAFLVRRLPQRSPRTEPTRTAAGATRWARWARWARWIPRPWLVGLVTFAATSLFFLLPDSLPAWVGVGADLALAAATVVLLLAWSRVPGWGDIHRLAAAGGALLTYVWLGFTQVPLMGSPGLVQRVGNVAFGLGTLALFTAAARAVRRPVRAGTASTSEVDSPDASPPHASTPAGSTQ